MERNEIRGEKRFAVLNARLASVPDTSDDDVICLGDIAHYIAGSPEADHDLADVGIFSGYTQSGKFLQSLEAVQIRASARCVTSGLF
jgi:hypothetical protein